MTNQKLFRILGALLAITYFFYCAASPYNWHFIDAANLIIHEAGHWIFWPFGEFMHILGGSLNQVLVPLVFVTYFALKLDFYSAGITLLWAGQNLINVSVYAGDAVKMQLPLLGGDNTIHDWNWLLFDLGKLHETAQIAAGIAFAGWTLLIIGAAAAIYFAFSYVQTKNFE